LSRLCAAPYVVEADSNRVGLRLRGTGLEWQREGELPSEGMVLGAVQVPPNGQPVVFLADHPPTGGYPVIGVVRREDLWQCGQLRPGDEVRFTPGPRRDPPAARG
jgi:allophanate hydrolase subunit 2